MAVNISSTCMGCQACIPTCPYEALYINDEGLCQVNDKNCDDCRKCIEACPVSALSMPAVKAGGKPAAAGNSPTESAKADLPGSKAVVPPRDTESCRGVWVFIEQEDGEVAPVSLELLGAGHRLAEKLGAELSGILLGDRVEDLADTLYEYGAERVYLVDDPVLRYYRTEAYSQVFVQLAREYLPEIILMGATTTGRDLAGAVATELRTGLTADCTGLDIDQSRRLLLATRPAFGGNIMATIVSKKHRPQMATVRPKVMSMAEPVRDRGGVLVKYKADLKEAEMLTHVLQIVKEMGDQVSLQDAEIIVAGGRGLGRPGRLQKDMLRASRRHRGKGGRLQGCGRGRVD